MLGLLEIGTRWWFGAAEAVANSAQRGGEEVNLLVLESADQVLTDHRLGARCRAAQPLVPGRGQLRPDSPLVGVDGLPADQAGLLELRDLVGQPTSRGDHLISQ